MAHLDLYALGLEFLESDDYVSAADHFIRALEMSPLNERYYNALGLSMYKLGQFQAAIDCFSQSIRFNEKYLEPYINCANALIKKNLYTEALQLLDHAIIHDPNSYAAYSNRGNILVILRELDDSILDFNKCIELNPAQAEGFLHRGIAFKHLANYQQALMDFSYALELDPFNIKALLNLANLYLDCNEPDKSISYFNSALKINPHHPEAHFQKSLCLLQMGFFIEAWQEYEWRWQRPQKSSSYLKSSKNLLKPGQRVHRLLIWSEQGIGDEIMFACQFPLLYQLADVIIIQAEPRLMSIFSFSFPNYKFISRDNSIPEDDYDAHLPIGNLCQHFLTSKNKFLELKNIYLYSPDQFRFKFNSELKSNKKFCGISWKSYAKEFGLDKSIALNDFLRRLDRDNLQLINLQYGDCEIELKAAESLFNISIFRPEFDLTKDFTALAALISECDQVISVSNSMLHLAAALGKECQLMLSKHKDWRWSLDPHQILWYKNLHFFEDPTEIPKLQ